MTARLPCEPIRMIPVVDRIAADVRTALPAPIPATRVVPF